MGRLLFGEPDVTHLAKPQAAHGVIESPMLDHRQMKAVALTVLQGGDPLIAARDSLDQLAARNRELLDGDSDAIREALADQVALLEATIASYTVKAAAARKADDARALQAVAIRAQATLVQVLGALHRVTEDQLDARSITA